MRSAAENEAGAMNDFIGMGMAMNAGGANPQNLYGMAAQQPAPAAPADGWKCVCGAISSGKFCTECGAKKPEAGWKCACGAVNSGKFCCECGAKKPGGMKCDKCGWTPKEGEPIPNFCPECGDPVTGDDLT